MYDGGQTGFPLADAPKTFTTSSLKKMRFDGAQKCQRILEQKGRLFGFIHIMIFPCNLWRVKPPYSMYTMSRDS